MNLITQYGLRGLVLGLVLCCKIWRLLLGARGLLYVFIILYLLLYYSSYHTKKI